MASHDGGDVVESGMEDTMERIALDAEVGQVSAELVRRGIAAGTRVHVTVEVMGDPDPPMAAIAQAGGGFDWLAEEPDLYDDADLVEPARTGLIGVFIGDWAAV